MIPTEVSAIVPPSDAFRDIATVCHAADKRRHSVLVDGGDSSSRYVPNAKQCRVTHGYVLLTLGDRDKPLFCRIRPLGTVYTPRVERRHIGSDPRSGPQCPWGESILSTHDRGEMALAGEAARQGDIYQRQ